MTRRPNRITQKTSVWSLFGLRAYRRRRSPDTSLQYGPISIAQPRTKMIGAPIPFRRLALALPMNSKLSALALTERYQKFPSGLATFMGPEFYVEQIEFLPMHYRTHWSRTTMA